MTIAPLRLHYMSAEENPMAASACTSEASSRAICSHSNNGVSKAKRVSTPCSVRQIYLHPVQGYNGTNGVNGINGTGGASHLPLRRNFAETQLFVTYAATHGDLAACVSHQL